MKPPLPKSLPKSLHWHQGILAQTVLAILAVTVLVGSVIAFLISQVVSHKAQDHVMGELSSLLDVVESTLSVACFANDEVLARELAQGLLRDQNVQQVEISAGETVLTKLSKQLASANVPPEGMPEGMPEALRLTRTIYSPFDLRQAIGVVHLSLDSAAIQAQVSSISRLFSAALWFSMLMVTVAAAAAVLYLVVRPIKKTSDLMHVLDVTKGEKLVIPDGHQGTEIGRLVSDINQLTWQLVLLVEKERTTRCEREIDERKYRNLFENASSGIFIAAEDGRLISSNRTFCTLVALEGVEAAEELEEGQQCTNLLSAAWSNPQEVAQLLRQAIEQLVSLERDFSIGLPQDGQQRWLNVAITPLGDGTAQGTLSDVTHRKNEEILARRLAVTDSLTSLANRQGLLQAHEGRQGEQGGLEPCTLVRLDLEGFKDFTTSMGYAMGDLVLLEVVQRLQALQSKSLLARLSGAKFAFVIPHADQAMPVEQLKELLQRTASAVAQPYVLSEQAGTPMSTSFNVRMGAARFPEDGQDMPELLRRADIALRYAQQHASASGAASFALFSSEQEEAAERQRHLEDELRLAVQQEKLRVFCQPIVELGSGRVVGGEALLRWMHQELGFISPEVFIPLAEQIGLINEIGSWVLEQACQRAAQWRGQGLDFYISVNVSVKQIPEGLPAQQVIDTLQRHGLDGSAIVIEITEGVLMQDVEVAQEWINTLRGAGLRIYMDDFGTGYSSLSYLKRFALDTVKIDKSFISDLRQGNSDYALVDAIITMARGLALNVVAEGIEESAQAALLQSMGCRYGQGYFYSRPVDIEQFVQTAHGINAQQVLQA